MSKNWFKIYRAIEDHELYFAEPFTRMQAWIDLIMIACYKDSVFFVRGNEVQVKRGYVAYAEDSLAKRWRWSRGKVQRFKKWLEIRQQIRQHNNKILSQIEIINYEKYQQNETTDERQTDDRQDTYKKIKKIKKNIIINNNNTSSIEEGIFENPQNQKEDNQENFSLSENKDSKIIIPGEQKNVSMKKPKEEKEKNKQMIDGTLEYLVRLLNKHQIASFKNEEKIIRRRVWNLICMVTRQKNPLPKEEWQRRIHLVLSDPCKHLSCWTNKEGTKIHNCNDINKLFEAIKGFVEPAQKQNEEPLERY